MPLFRREPLHVRLAREGGLGEQPPEGKPRPLWQEPGVSGLYMPRQADVVVTVDAGEVEGERARFVALPDGTLLVEEGEGTLAPLASAVEQSLAPPYRARAVRRGETLWALEASSIEVMPIPDGPDGDTIDLTRTADGTTLAVDDAGVFDSIPALAARGEREGREYTVHAERLDGDLWEVRANPL